jgi:hypothetical protein
VVTGPEFALVGRIFEQILAVAQKGRQTGEREAVGLVPIGAELAPPVRK